MAATVMEGIETQQHPFVSVIDQGHFTSDRLEGAGTKVVKRTAEAMDAMVKTYEEKAAELEHPQQKRMKRAADTGGYMGKITEKVDPIVSTRSPQALAIVKAKLIVDPEGKDGGGEAGKWIVPPHSLVFALRDREQYVISAVADVQNFYNKSSGEAKYAPIGVSLEDGLDATKFHTEHESRRYFSVAVEGVVSLQCDREDAKNFNFGDPVFVNTTAGTAGCFKLNFYDTTHYRLTNNGTFRIGYFVETIDRVRGGIRVKLAIRNQAKNDRLNNRSSTIITDAKTAYENVVKDAIETVYDKTSKSLKVADETEARNKIGEIIDDVKNGGYRGFGSLNDAVEQYYANIGFPYDNFITKEETAAKRRANAQLDIELAEAAGVTPAPAAVAAVASTVGSESEENKKKAVSAMIGFANNFHHLEYFYEEFVKVSNNYNQNQKTLKTLGLGPRNGKNPVLKGMIQKYIDNRKSFFTSNLDDKRNFFEELEEGLKLYMSGGYGYDSLKPVIIDKLGGDLSFLYNIDDEGSPKLAEAQYFDNVDKILYKATPDDVRNAGEMLRELITKLFEAADKGKDVSEIDFEYIAKNDPTIYQEEIDKLDAFLRS